MKSASTLQRKIELVASSSANNQASFTYTSLPLSSSSPPLNMKYYIWQDRWEFKHCEFMVLIANAILFGKG